jgi:hypothetical protein
MSEDDEFSLSDSRTIGGEIQPIIIDKHGNIVDGFHRKGVFENWPVWKNDHIETQLQLAYARLASNTNRRKVSDDEISKRLVEIYDEHKKVEGKYPPPLLVGKNLGRSQDWVLKHLPDSYKAPNKVKAGQVGGQISAIRRQTETGCASETGLELRLSQIGFKRLKSVPAKDGKLGVIDRQTKGFHKVLDEDPHSRIEAAIRKMFPEGVNELEKKEASAPEPEPDLSGFGRISTIFSNEERK